MSRREVHGAVLVALAVIALALTATLGSMCVAEAAAQPTIRTLGTQFGHPGDRWAGQYFGCYFEGKRRRMNHRVVGVAHRSWKCGTIVRVCALYPVGEHGHSIAGGPQCEEVPVVDRGPYWQVPKVVQVGPRGWRCNPYRQWCWRKGGTNKKAPTQLMSGYTWSHSIDVMYRVALRIGLGGKRPATIQRLRRKDLRWTNHPAMYKRPRRGRR